MLDSCVPFCRKRGHSLFERIKHLLCQVREKSMHCLWNGFHWKMQSAKHHMRCNLHVLNRCLHCFAPALLLLTSFLGGLPSIPAAGVPSNSLALRSAARGLPHLQYLLSGLRHCFVAWKYSMQLEQEREQPDSHSCSVKYSWQPAHT